MFVTGYTWQWHVCERGTCDMFVTGVWVTCLWQGIPDMTHVCDGAHMHSIHVTVNGIRRTHFPAANWNSPVRTLHTGWSNTHRPHWSHTCANAHTHMHTFCCAADSCCGIAHHMTIVAAFKEGAVPGLYMVSRRVFREQEGFCTLQHNPHGSNV